MSAASAMSIGSCLGLAKKLVQSSSACLPPCCTHELKGYKIGVQGCTSQGARGLLRIAARAGAASPYDEYSYTSTGSYC